MNDNDQQSPPSPDLMQFVTAATEAISDSMVQRMASTASNAMELLDQFNDEETREAVTYALDRLTKLHRQGGLNTIFDSLEMIHGARMAMTDSMINRMFQLVEHAANSLANEDMLSLVHNSYQAMEDAKDEVAKMPPVRGGLFAAIALLQNPETVKALRFMITYSGKLQERLKDG